MAKKEEKVTKTEEKKNTKKETKKDYSHEVVIKIDGDKWKEAVDAVFKEKQKTAKVDGFRTGKVPRAIYEKHFGKESLFLDAADRVLQEAYLTALSESKLIPVVKPAVDLSSIGEDHCEFKFRIITKPDVKVKKYKGLKVEKQEVKVTKEEVDHEIEHLLEHYAELATKEKGKVESGNIAIIDFEGFKDGVAFDGGKGENYSLEIGSNTFIPGFEDAVIGMKTGEEKDIDLTFPEDYGVEDLAGQKVVFKVKVYEIKEKINRKLDEDFFEDLGMKDVTNEKELRASIEKSIKTQRELEVENAYIDALIEEISKSVEVDIPEEMVQEEIDNLKHRFEHEMSHQGITLDMYYKFTGTTEKDLENQLEKEAYQSTLYRLMLEEIKNLEEIKATDEEINEELDKTAEEYQITKEQVLQSIGKEEIEYQIEMKKTIDRIKELNK